MLMDPAARANALLLCLIGNDTVTFGEDRDERKWVLPGGCCLARVFLEEVLKLRRDRARLALVPGFACSVSCTTAALTDHFSNRVADGVAHTSLLSNPLLLRQVGLQVVLGVILELAVQVLVFKLDSLLFFFGLAFEELTALITPVVLLNHLGRLCFFLLLLLVQFVEVGLCVDDSRDDMSLEGCFICLKRINLLIYHGTMYGSLLDWHFVS